MNHLIDICLPYYKQGDDLSFHLRNNPSHPEKAFRDHASQLLAAAAALNSVADVVAGVPAEQLEIQADCHFIGIFAPDETREALLKLECASESDWDDDEDEDGEDLESDWDDEVVVPQADASCPVDCESCQ